MQIPNNYKTVHVRGEKMEFKEYRAKTVQDAITDALIELETTSDKIEYEVIEEGSAGLLGLFSRNAVVRVRKKEGIVEEEFTLMTSLTKEEKPAGKEETAPEKKPAKKEPAKKEPAKKEPVKKDTAEKKDAPEKKEPAKKETRVSGTRQIDTEKITSLLQAIFAKLDIEAEIQIEIDQNEKVVNINVEGDDTGDIIGKRGQTLDAIQYLISIIVNKKQDEYYRVKLDTNNYRERRQKTLENLAKNVAAKVKKTRKKVALEPMNPYERRVIHSYLQSDKFVTTKSEGEEPNRRVVVYYKKS